MASKNDITGDAIVDTKSDLKKYSSDWDASWPIPEKANRIVITTYWDDVTSIIEHDSPITFVLGIKDWLTLSEIPHKILIRSSKDYAMFRDVHQITIEFVDRSDMATFKMGHTFSIPVDIQYF